MGLTSEQILAYKFRSKNEGNYSNVNGESADELFRELTEKTAQRDAKLAYLNRLEAGANVDGISIATLEARVAYFQREHDIARQKALDCQSARDAKKINKNGACHSDDLSLFYRNWGLQETQLNDFKKKLSDAKAARVSTEADIAKLQSEINSLNQKYKSQTGQSVNTSTGNSANDAKITSATSKYGSSGGINKMYFIVGGVAVLGVAGFLLFKRK